MTFADLYPFEPHYFTHADGIRQHYVDEGAGETIVMLHGNPTWSFFYRDLIKRFRGERRVIVPDHIGMGLSDKPQAYPYRLERHIANLDALLRQAAPEGKITLVMHDWGGAIAMGWATEHINRVARLVILNTAAFPFPRIPLRINVCRIPGFGALAIRGLNAFAGLATLMTTVKPLTPEVRRGFLKPYNNWENRIATLRFVQDIPMSPTHPSFARLKTISDKLPQLAEIPMLIQWGGKDWCFDDFFYEEWVKRFPRAELGYYGDAGHYLLEDNGEEIGARIAAFFAKNPG